MSQDLHPVFQMNLPEGTLLEAIRRAIAKLAGEDDLTILRITGVTMQVKKTGDKVITKARWIKQATTPSRNRLVTTR